MSLGLPGVVLALTKSGSPFVFPSQSLAMSWRLSSPIRLHRFMEQVIPDRISFVGAVEKADGSVL